MTPLDAIVSEIVAFWKCFIDNLFEWIFTLSIVIGAVAIGLVVEPRSDRAIWENFNERYPYTGETIGVPVLFGIIIVVPCALLGLLAIFNPGKISLGFIYLSLAQVLGITLFVTEALKVVVARPRPSYFSYCGYDEKRKECTASRYAQKDAKVSFPSGHASNAFACGTWCFQFIRQYKQNAAEIWWVLLQLVPIGIAIFVAATRITDYMHHVSDVVGGAVLGVGVAVVVFQSQATRLFVQQPKKMFLPYSTL
jgi:diacylglycerol diphosphate phosphatase/phosphatidate phosphatase